MESFEERAAGVSFASLEGEPGVELVDPIERRRYRLYTTDHVDPTSVDPDEVGFPVDGAVAVETASVTCRQTVEVHVRDESGAVVAQPLPATEESLPHDTYTVELNAPIKVYLRVESGLSISVETDRMRFSFGGDVEVYVGARSYHQHPAATVTTTPDPEDVLTALSYLGSALKTTASERSYPTLRGHPPTFEVGDSLDVPDGLTAPTTGVRLELPATRRAAYVAAPLAYYLGAEVVPADEPAITTSGGFDYHLDSPDGFEAAVERALKQVFFLDCLVRTEGIYGVDLAERETVEPRVDVDLAALYGQSLEDQLATYLSIPFETLADHVPQWQLTAYLPADPEYATAVPFLTDQLAVIRTPRADRPSPAEVQSATLESYLDGRPPRSQSATRTGSVDEADRRAVIQPRATDSLEAAWFGPGIPIGASKASTRAYRNKLAREPNDDRIEIGVVCNEREMDSEYEAAHEAYDSRDELSFDVTMRRDCSTGELADLLGSGVDFLHYIGHIDADGFECPDGVLDASTLDAVDVDAFFLNACRSYEQGAALVDAGALGGVVTFSDVLNDGAIRVGETMARLLDRGFPLRGALTLARETSVVGGNYIVVGDGTVDVAQQANAIPILCDVESVEEDQYDLTVVAYPSRAGGMGTVVYPTVERNDYHYLSPGELATFRLTREELVTYLDWHEYPVRMDGELVWDVPL